MKLLFYSGLSRLNGKELNHRKRCELCNNRNKLCNNFATFAYIFLPFKWGKKRNQL